MLSAIIFFTVLICHYGTNANNNVTADKPNILIIVADDMGIGDLSCYGNSPIKTPNIDSITTNGVKFNRMYSQPVCTPSRASLLTGRLPVRSGLLQGKRRIPVAISPNQNAGLKQEEYTMAEYLKKQGYKTAAVGKWHIGMGSDNAYLPTRQGFDSFLGIPMTHIEPCSHYTEMDVSIFFGIAVNKYKYAILTVIAFVLSLYMMQVIGSKGLFRFLILAIIATATARLFIYSSAANPGACLYMRDEEILEQPYKEVNMTLRMTSEIMNIIENHAKSENPMFLYINYLTPHYPALVSDKFNGSTGLGPYYDSIVEMDWSIGIILKQLEKHGMKNNFIYFTSDNGPAPLTGFSRELLEPEHVGSTKFKDRNGESLTLRGWKGSNYEGGIRIPAVVQWNNIANPGREFNGISSHMDVFPTLVDLLGHKTENDVEFDGKSLIPVLNSESVKETHRVMYHYCAVNALGAISYQNYKLHFMNSTINYTCSGNVFNEPELYNLDTDPAETSPLPLDDYQDVLKEIYASLEEHEKTLPPVGDRVSQLDNIPNPFTFPCSNFPSCSIESKVEDDFSKLPL